MKKVQEILLKKYKSQIDESDIILKSLLENPTSLEEIDRHLGIIDSAKSKIEMIKYYFCSTKEKILKLKPNSIFDFIDESFFIESGVECHEYIKSRNCYEVYYAISKYFQPKSILEIGVRFGYSLGAMIVASDNIENAIGYDIDQYDKDSTITASTNIKKIIKNINLSIQFVNSQEISVLDRYYDIIHIDGDHSYDGKMHDLNLTIDKCRVVIVDDYHFIEWIGRACNSFAEKHKDKIQETIVIDSFRGTFIIIYK